AQRRGAGARRHLDLVGPRPERPPHERREQADTVDTGSGGLPVRLDDELQARGQRLVAGLWRDDPQQPDVNEAGTGREAEQQRDAGLADLAQLELRADAEAREPKAPDDLRAGDREAERRHRADVADEV